MQLIFFYICLLYVGVGSLSLAPFTYANANYVSPTQAKPSLGNPPQKSPSIPYIEAPNNDPINVSPPSNDNQLGAPSSSMSSRAEAPSINASPPSNDNNLRAPSSSISSRAEAPKIDSINASPPSNDNHLEAPSSSISSRAEAPSINASPPNNGKLRSTPKINATIVKHNESSPSTSDVKGPPKPYKQGGWHYYRNGNPNPRYENHDSRWHYYYTGSPKPSPTSSHGNTWPKPWSPRRDRTAPPYWPNHPENSTRTDKWHGSYWPGQGSWRTRGGTRSPLPARASPPCAPSEAPKRWPRRFSPHY